MQSIQSKKAFPKPLPISQFINPLSKRIKDTPEEIFTSIIKRYAKTPDSDDSSSKEEQEDVVPVPYSEVLKALETLTLYEQQHKDSQNKVI